MEPTKKQRQKWGKGIGWLLLSIVIAFATHNPCSVGACPYDADIILNGSNYSDISGIRNFEPGGWVIDSDVIYTFWENEWVEYTAYLTEGIWKIGICAINYSHSGHDGLGSDPTWYPQFELSNSLTDDIVIVPASDTVINYGYFCFEVTSDGFYTVRFTWLNDKTWGERPDGLPILDANIQIERIFFEEVSTIMVDIDIKPQSCPNVLNVKSRGVLPVAILGSDEFDVSNIDSDTISLEGVSPLRSSIEDVATPIFDGVDCDCTTDGPDGFTDLTLKFDTQEVVAILGEVEGGQECILYLTGQLNDGTPIEGADCIRLVPEDDNNEEWVEISFVPHAQMQTDRYGGIAFYTGFGITLWDDSLYAYNQGARSAIITGPGLPVAGQVLEHYYPEPNFRLYPKGEWPASGGWGLWLDDTAISSIPDNATYTIGIYEETGDTVSLSDTPLQSYTKTFARGPVLNLELNDSLFPTLITPSSHDESVLDIPGMVDVSWSNPSNMLVDFINIGLHSPDWSTGYQIMKDVTPGDTSATLDTTSLPLDVLANQLYMHGTDIYGRRFGFAWALF